MITFLQGTLAEKTPSRVVINVGGIGYEVQIPLSSYDRLPSPEAMVKLLTYYHVREDAHQLFGFVTDDERDLFDRLMGVSGIGPKLALAALSGMSVREIKLAIVAGDNKRLAGISGIGKKTAERIVLELKDKITPGEALEATAGAGAETEKDVRLRDTMMALISLGYKQVEAMTMAREAAAKAGPDANVEELVRKSLARG